MSPETKVILEWAAAIIVQILLGFWAARAGLLRVRSQNQTDDATAATAYARLNKELRQQVEDLSSRVGELENIRTAPLRITTDIMPYPDPHVIRSEVVVMASSPTVINPGESLERKKK